MSINGMTMFGTILAVSGMLLAILSVAVSSERLEAATWKSKWVEKRFGKLGLRIYLFLVGVVFVWLGLQIRASRFPW